MLEKFKGVLDSRSDEYRLLKKLKPEKLPSHVAIIMDGNGRWAQQRNLERIEGHKKGSDAAREITECAARLGLNHLTLFTFSSENWKRPASEIRFLMTMLYENLVKKSRLLYENDIRLKVIGQIDRLAVKLQRKLAKLQESTSTHRRMQLNLALNYGSRQEILGAVQRIAADRIAPAAINHDVFQRYLDTADIPDPDLLIRTSGEYRISNFLLYQIAYSELFFSPVLWPDFKTKEFLSVLIDFQGRQRRFGNL